MEELERYFESKVEIPLIRHGNRQRHETLINEEALVLAKYLRDEITNWTPRIATVYCTRASVISQSLRVRAGKTGSVMRG